MFTRPASCLPVAAGIFHCDSNGVLSNKMGTLFFQNKTMFFIYMESKCNNYLEEAVGMGKAGLVA